MKLTLEQIEKILRKNNGNLDLSGTSINNLPEGLIVNGWLDLSNTQITRLPEGLIVGGSLYLENTPITRLPRDLTVGGWLVLSGTSITRLPKGLTVGGWLYLCYTQITKLPENLTVGGSIDLSGTKIKNLPKSLMVGGKVYGLQIKNLKYEKLKNGNYVPEKYLYANDVLTHVKRCYKVKGYTLYVGKIKGRNAVSDGKNYVLCRTFRDGIAEILCKNVNSGV